MRSHRAAILSGAVGLMSFVAIGTGASASAYASTAHPSTVTSVMPASQHTAQKPTVHTVTTDVNGRSEAILVDVRGLPLYYHRGDTARKSRVTGVLAQLWPPLVSAHPTGTGTHGRLGALNAVVAHQVAYNGRFLYTFVDDAARHVTGQGVSDFFVATPNLKSISSSSTAAPVASAGSNGYGY